MSARERAAVPEGERARARLRLNGAAEVVKVVGAGLGILVTLAGAILWLTGGLAPGQHAAALLGERVVALERRVSVVEDARREQVATLQAIARMEQRLEDIARRLGRIEARLDRETR